MKKCVLAIFALSFVGLNSFAETYSCAGVKGTKGTAKLVIDGRVSSMSAKYLNTANGDGTKSLALSCTGDNPNQQKTFTYVGVSRNAQCPFDYLRIPDDIGSGGGLVAVVSYQGGDTHDSSGYLYEYFYCGGK